MEIYRLTQEEVPRWGGLGGRDGSIGSAASLGTPSSHLLRLVPLCSQNDCQQSARISAFLFTVGERGWIETNNAFLNLLIKEQTAFPKSPYQICPCISLA